MSAIPCPINRDLNAHQREVDREADYQARIEAKAVQLRAEYRQDVDVLWESLGNVTSRKSIRQFPAIAKAIRDGGTLHELAAAMHGLRELLLAESDDTANIRAEGEVQKEDEREERQRMHAQLQWIDEL